MTHSGIVDFLNFFLVKIRCICDDAVEHFVNLVTPILSLYRWRGMVK